MNNSILLQGNRKIYLDAQGKWHGYTEYWVEAGPQYHYPVTLTVADSAREMALCALENAIADTQDSEEAGWDNATIHQGEVTIGGAL